MAPHLGKGEPDVSRLEIISGNLLNPDYGRVNSIKKHMFPQSIPENIGVVFLVIANTVNVKWSGDAAVFERLWESWMNIMVNPIKRTGFSLGRP